MNRRAQGARWRDKETCYTKGRGRGLPAKKDGKEKKHTGVEKHTKAQKVGDQIARGKKQSEWKTIHRIKGSRANMIATEVIREKGDKQDCIRKALEYDGIFMWSSDVAPSCGPCGAEPLRVARVAPDGAERLRDDKSYSHQR
ncbi:unnamed protein product [Heligmosomoides polygyrus]|uniref:Reverse transcriptase domain-containing protein n=1 Tax=Heligmosomoides polygyrus TaxID=6339 RepID=A0A183GPI3_HELPZ|nr:unnamed protein product [Heligmosomoides polygyrus]